MLSSRDASRPGVLREWSDAAAAHMKQEAYCSSLASSPEDRNSTLHFPLEHQQLLRVAAPHPMAADERAKDFREARSTSASFPLGISAFSGWATSSHCTIAMLSLMMVEPSL